MSGGQDRRTFYGFNETLERERSFNMNRRSPIFLQTCVTLLLLLASLASARPVRIWSFRELTDQADLIVIAIPLAVRDTGQKTNIAAYPATSVETTFEVFSVVKGEKDAQKIVFHHFRRDRGPKRVGGTPQVEVNPPGLVSFAPKEKKRYLLFLKREEDGRYSALTGQTDPVNAVHELCGASVTKESLK
jgi:hypothetical protein